MQIKIVYFFFLHSSHFAKSRIILINLHILLRKQKQNKTKTKTKSKIHISSLLSRYLLPYPLNVSTQVK